MIHVGISSVQLTSLYCTVLYPIIQCITTVRLGNSGHVNSFQSCRSTVTFNILPLGQYAVHTVYYNVWTLLCIGFQKRPASSVIMWLYIQLFHHFFNLVADCEMTQKHDEMMEDGGCSLKGHGPHSKNQISTEQESGRKVNLQFHNNPLVLMDFFFFSILIFNTI